MGQNTILPFDDIMKNSFSIIYFILEGEISVLLDQ